MRVLCFLSLLIVPWTASCSDGGGDGDGPTDPPINTEWRPAFDATDTGWLLNTWGPSGDELYAVGGSPDAGVIVRYDGEAWTPMELGLDTPLVNWGYGFGSNDITFVGNAGSVLHYDGTSFTAQSTPTEQALWGVWGAAPNDMWAVGGEGREDGQATLLHYDGSTWESVAIPMLQKANVWAFFKVWGTSADNVYVVGQRGAVLHYDGNTWSEELVGASDDLISVWGTGPDHIVAVGGRGNGIVSLWNGTEWRTESLSPMPGLNGVFTRNPSTIHVVGQVGTIAKLDGTTLEVLDQKVQQTPLDLHAVFADDNGRLTAVGGSLNSQDPPFRGVALMRDLEEDE